MLMQAVGKLIEKSAPEYDLCGIRVDIIPILYFTDIKFIIYIS